MFLLGLIHACSLYPSSLTLTVHLPPPPDHWQTAFPRLRYRLVYPRDETGDFDQLPTDGRTPVRVELPKACFLPVLAYPDPAAGIGELPPAGGVYPLDCTASGLSLLLSWEQGPAAEALRRLLSSGVDCSAVNVERLRREMSGRCRGDPWALDLEHIGARLASGQFRLTDIRLAPGRDVTIETGPGRWFLESPFRRPVTVEPEGLLSLEAVPLGAHFLFDGDSGACLFLYLGEETLLSPTPAE
ncbi:MAG: hypothetical protein JXB06_05580 [Spirochaetales bacterium]|nr:hypothetical protein [Spirochaetales bacterium]